MYEGFYGLRGKPFSIAPDPAFLFLSKKHRRALALLEYGLLNQVGFSVITGAIGSGKTTLVRKLLHRADGNLTIGLVSNTQCGDFAELLQWILLAFGLEYRNKGKVELYHDFEAFLRREYEEERRVVIIIDEAQHLTEEALEQLRLLSNINTEQQLFQIIMVGQPDLWHLLHAPALEQFAQRIGVDYYLEPLDRGDTAGYISHRLSVVEGRSDLFEPEAVERVWELTRGVPRLINLLCDMALVYAYSEQAPRIAVRFIDEVAHDKRKGLMPLTWGGDSKKTSDFLDSSQYGW